MKLGLLKKIHTRELERFGVGVDQVTFVLVSELVVSMVLKTGCSNAASWSPVVLCVYQILQP